MSLSHNIEVKQVSAFDEIIRLSSLFHKFFQEIKNDYTEQEFYQKIPYLLENGVIFYILDNQIPRAYLIAVRINMIGKDALLVFQAYSEKPFYIKKIREIGDRWAIENGYGKYIALVEPSKENYFLMNYGMKREFILVSKELKLQDTQWGKEIFNGKDEKIEEVRIEEAK